MRILIRTLDGRYYSGVSISGRVIWTNEEQEAHTFLNLKSAEYCMNGLPENLEAEIIDISPDAEQILDSIRAIE